MKVSKDSLSYGVLSAFEAIGIALAFVWCVVAVCNLVRSFL